MSKKDDGGPAFPREDYQTDNAAGQIGMTLRDYFAAKAMAAILVADGTTETYFHNRAREAYLMADAMLAAREAKQ